MRADLSPFKPRVSTWPKFPYGDRRGRQHLEDGYGWCVDLDLEKFFDLVCHQRLGAKLAERVGDRRLLVLIGRLLKAEVVLPDGW